MRALPPITTVAVLGTGSMGTGIAAACAKSGFDVLFASRSRERAAASARRLSATTPPGRVQATEMTVAGIGRADLVIESVIEEEETKSALLERVESCVPDSTVVATNTSSLSIADMQQKLRAPGRFLGLHFLLPAEWTPLVEVIPGPATVRYVQQRCLRFVEGLGKQAILVSRERPGFVWNRLQFAMLREAVHLLTEGIASAEDIDRAVSLGLAPRWLAAGPLGTADLGGPELFAALATRLFPYLCGSGAPPAVLRDARGDAGVTNRTAVELAQLGRLRDEILRRLFEFLRSVEEQTELLPGESAAQQTDRHGASKA